MKNGSRNPKEWALLVNKLVELSAKEVRADALFVHAQNYMRDEMIEFTANLFMSSGARFIILNGYEYYEPNGPGFDHWRDRLVKKYAVPERAIYRMPKADHTAAEAIAFMEIAKKESVRSAIIITTPEHIFRAFLTDLWAMKNAGLEIALNPKTIFDVNWMEQIEVRSVLGAEEVTTRLGKFAGECARVATYRMYYESGERDYTIASVEEGIKYFSSLA